MRTKPFDLEKAIAGQPVLLRNGDKAFVRHYEKELEVDYELQGYVIRSSSNLTTTWTKEGYIYSGSVEASNQDIIGMWVEPPVFKHWNVLDPRWQFIAADEDGDICVYTIRPTKHKKFWRNGCDEFEGFMKITNLFNFQYTDWEYSLVERSLPNP